MANSGEVQLDVVAMARDEVTATMNKVNGEMDAMRAKIAQYERAQKSAQASSEGLAKATGGMATTTGGAARQIEALEKRVQGALGPVDKVKGLIEKVTGNLGFFGAAIGGVVVGLGGLIAKFLETEPRIDPLTAKLNATATAAFEAARGIGKLVAESARLGSAVRGIQSEMLAIDAQIADLQGRATDAFELRKAQGVQDQANAIKLTELELEKANASTEAAREAYKAARAGKQKTDTDVASLKATIEWRKAQGASVELQEAQLAKAVVTQASLNTSLLLSKSAFHQSAQAADDYALKIVKLEGLQAAIAASTPTPEKPTGGGGGSRPPKPTVRPQDKLAAAINPLGSLTGVGGDVVRPQALPKELTPEEQQKRAQAELELMWDGSKLELDIKAAAAFNLDVALAAVSFDEWSTSTEQLVERLRDLSDILTGPLATAWPEMASALSEVDAVSAKYSSTVAELNKKVQDGSLSAAQAETKASQARTQAIIAGSTSVLAAIGKTMGGLKAEYALRAGGEFAAAIASAAAYDYGAAALHTIAGTSYAIQAGTAPKGGGAGGGGGGGGSRPQPSAGGSSGSGGGGGGTVINNFNSLVSDPQTIHRAIRESEIGSRNNGYAQRRGA